MNIDIFCNIFRNPANDESEDAIRARLAKLKGIPETQPSNQNILLSKPVKPSPLQEKDLLDQMQDEIELEKSMPNPDEELETRLAKLKGVDVEAIRRPGKGLDNKPSIKTETGPDIDPEAFLHDHSAYSAKTSGEVSDTELMKEITNLNKEVSFFLNFDNFKVGRNGVICYLLKFSRITRNYHRKIFRKNAPKSRKL